MSLFKFAVAPSTAGQRLKRGIGGIVTPPPEPGPEPEDPGYLPVVPGGRGFGMATPAGRGGQIIHVTNSNESGTGSLAEAVNTSGPRVVVFDEAVDIFLTSDLSFFDPYITIAGQTAPAPGVMIRGAALKCQTNDVLVQHVAFRPGDDVSGGDPDDRDGFKAVHNEGTVSRIVIDHCSFQWSIDELLSIWRGGPKEITFWYCMFAEPLFDSLHSKGQHAYGPIVSGSHKATFIGNFLGNARARLPRIDRCQQLYYVNNYVRDYTGRAVDIGDSSGSQRLLATITGNEFDSDSGQHPIEIRDGIPTNSEFWIDGNIGKNFDGIDPWSQVDVWSPLTRAEIEAASQADAVPDPTGFTPLAASNVKADVLANCGHRPAARDAIDARIVSNAQNDIDSHVDSPSAVGGYPSWPANAHTGGWTEPANPDADDDGDGYTNLEEQLHSEAAAVE